MAKKIVLAEDESHIARLITFKLEREGYEIHWAADGGSALEKVKEVIPDLVLLDIMMPVMDGYEVLKNIKRDDSLKDIPVIMLTAKSQEQDIIKGFDLGSEDYIVKPFKPAELAARIKKILRD
jgi:two-component system, OmpR family, alkaline phosphatase synthesis response regulator PhoP